MTAQSTQEMLRRMAQAWGQTAARAASLDSFIADVRGTSADPSPQQAYRATFAQEFTRFRLTLAGIPLALYSELLALFAAAEDPEPED